jgi:hypothetical protein
MLSFGMVPSDVVPSDMLAADMLPADGFSDQHSEYLGALNGILRIWPMPDSGPLYQSPTLPQLGLALPTMLSPRRAV